MAGRLERFVFAAVAAGAMVAGGAGCSTIEEAPTTDELIAQVPDDRRPTKVRPERLAVAPVAVALVGTTGEAPAGGKGEAGGAATAPASGVTPSGGTSGPTGTIEIQPDKDAAPGGKQTGMRRVRRAATTGIRDGEMVAIRYRTPLFREVLFAPENEAPPSEAPVPAEAPAAPSPAGGDAAAAPAADAAPADSMRIQWICPRCQNDVGKDDRACAVCYLPFAPEDAGADVHVARPEPAKPDQGAETAHAKDGSKPVSPQPEAGTVTPPPAETAVAPPATPEPAKPEPAPSEAAPAPVPPARPVERFVCFMCNKEVAPTEESCPNCGLALEYPPGYEPAEAARGGQAIGKLAVREMKATDSRHVSFYPDPDDVQAQVVSTLRGYKLFSTVDAIKKPEIAEDREALIDYAREAEYDYVLMPKVTRWEVSYLGINAARYIPAMALWIAAWVPSWWVAGDDFQAEIEMTFKLVHVRSGQEIPWKSVYRGTRRFHVDQFDRGWYPWGILAVPVANFIFDSGWRNLNDKISPHALAAIKRELIEEGFYNTFVKVEPPIFTPKEKQSVALLVGTDLFEKNIRALRYPSADVDLMAKTLGETSGFNKVIRMEPRAQDAALASTTANIRAWLAGELQRLGSPDLVVLYFAGYGVAVKTPNTKWKDGYEKYYVTSDTDPANIPGTAFPLSEIGNALREAKVGRALVILDCSFAKTETDVSIGFGRTLGAIDVDTALKIEDPSALDGVSFLEDMTLRGGGKKAVVMAACAMTEVALETEYLGDGHGVLTYYFCEAVNGMGDETGNKDGQVELLEAINNTIIQVRAFGTKSGFPQEVQVYGDQNSMQAIFKRAAPKAVDVSAPGGGTPGQPR